MSRAPKPPRIVAELGRPETPDETAARLAENSRKYRSHKTVNNLVLSLLATLVTVLVIVLIVPRSDTPIERDINVSQVASQVQVGQTEHMMDPTLTLPAGWRANAATWSGGGSDDVSSWYIGMLSPANQFIGLTQAIDANQTWVASKLAKQPASDVVVIDGVTWDVYTNGITAGDRGNFEYALTTVAGSSTYLLIGTAEPDEFRVLASALTPDIQANGTR